MLTNEQIIELEKRKESIVNKLIFELNSDTLTEAKANSIAGRLAEVQRLIKGDKVEKIKAEKKVVDNLSNNT